MLTHATLKSLKNTFERIATCYLPAFCVLAACSFEAAHAEIYKSVDKHGRVVYTDRPSPSDKNSAVELPVLNTQPPVQSTAKNPTRATDEAVPNYEVLIIAPANQSQIPMGQHQVPVNLQLTPQLGADHHVQLYLDGQPFGSPSRSPQLMLDNLHRGEHTLVAAVVDKQGKALKRSASVLFYVQRRTVLN